MSRLGIGVIGAGNISAMHLRAYAANHHVELVAIHDLNLARAQERAQRFGVDRVYPALQELLADPAVDAVSICTWNNSHADLAIASLEAGKNVLLEKPLSKTVAEAEAIAAAVERTGKRLQVGFVRRFSANAKLLRQFIDAGDLGEIYYAKASNIRRIGNPGGWFADLERAGGGPLIDIGVHVLDLCWYMMGSPKAVTVSGNTYRRLGNRANITNLGRYKATDYDPDKSDVEDLANALIRFENGASLYLETSYSLHAPEDQLLVAVYGEKGGAELEPSLRLATESCNTLLNVAPQVDLLTFNFDEGFQNEIDHFVSLCLGEAEEVAPVAHGVEVMRMLSAIYESAALGGEVAL
ncbi:MAG: Gfo/Idh/MocA family oxidoreductase [Terracoccus sp.]